MDHHPKHDWEGDVAPRPTCSSVRDAPFANFLVHLGMPEDVDIYYLFKRAGRWPIGNTGGEGGKLIASKRRLARHARKNHRTEEYRRLTESRWARRWRHTLKATADMEAAPSARTPEPQIGSNYNARSN